ncbi:MAG TPA: PfkB family carbohydrate kinase [Bryobacterales bacterium]|nr:PfkB family carbohydrate kinase [Bryobacterales bacterium]
MSLLVVGSVAYDGVETPHGKVERMLGGAATYIALAASHFSQVNLVGVVGDDFEPEDAQLLAAHGIDLEGLEKKEGKTFFWSGIYSDDMNERTTLTTQLNVFADFNPQLPSSYRDSPYAVVGNIHPTLQKQVRDQMKAPLFVGGDTMNFWIEGTPSDLAAAIRQWDFILINDSEARLLTGEYNLRNAARKILDMGPHTVVIKRGEYGAILFRAEGHFIAPGFLLETVFDPTGAGDSFAGGFMGYLAEQRIESLDTATHEHLRKAMIYGSVMGSFCCEEFGVGRLRALTRDEIDARYREFKAFTEF